MTEEAEKGIDTKISKDVVLAHEGVIHSGR